MRLLDRYLLRELLVPLGYCLCGFLIFWVFSDLFSTLAEFQKKKLLPWDIAEYYLVSTPEFLVVVVPIALLLALLYALTNHARHHEITAMRAAGISLWRLCLPYLAVGFLASLGLFALNEFWVPDSVAAAEQILNRRVPRPPGALGPNQVRDLGFNNARDGRKWQIGVYNSDTGEMIRPKVIWTLPDGSVRWISAERGLRTNGVWKFYNVSEHKESPQVSSLPVPAMRTNVLAFPEFSETPEQIKSEIRLSNIALPGSKKADIPILEILNYLRLHPRPSRTDGDWLYTKLHGRLAAPWTCLVVVLIAIPFGAASGRRNVFVGVASSILICFIYFVLQQVGLALGSGGWVPPWIAGWFPNLAFGITGLWLTAMVR
ncbi:MAG: lipopolysaccharide export system permease protein [Verrucomicrobiota bacterium]